MGKQVFFFFYLLVYVKRKAFFIPTGKKGEFRIPVTVLLFPYLEEIPTIGPSLYVVF